MHVAAEKGSSYITMLVQTQRDHWKGICMEIEKKVLSEEEIETVSGGAAEQGTVTENLIENVPCAFCGSMTVYNGTRTYFDPLRGKIIEHVPFHCTTCGKAWSGKYVLGNGNQIEWIGVLEILDKFEK